MSDPANVFRSVLISREVRDALSALGFERVSIADGKYLWELVAAWDAAAATEVDVTSATLPSPGWSVKA